MIKEHDVMNGCVAQRNLHKFEKIVVLSVLFIGLSLMFLAIPVLALFESGWLGTMGSINTTVFQLTGTDHYAGAGNIIGIKFENIENFQEPYSIVSTISKDWMTLPAASGFRDVNLYAGDIQIGTGALGYNDVGTYQVFLYFYTWNPGGLMGTHFINFTTADAAKSWNSFGETLGYVSSLNAGSDTVAFSTYSSTQGSKLLTQSAPTYPPVINNKYSRFETYWSIESYGTYFTRVNVSKTTFSGINYTSKVYVMNLNSVVAYESAYKTANYSGVFSQTPISISILDYYNRWWNTSSYFGVQSSYNITVTPSQITPILNATGQISSNVDPTLSAIRQIAWEYQDSDGTHNLYENSNQSRPMFYSKIGTNWYGYDLIAYDFLNNKGTAIPNPVTFQVATSGDKIVTCRLIDLTGHVYDLTATLTVASGYVTTTARAIDAISNARIRGATISFWDITDVSWTNTTTSALNNDEASVVTPAGHIFNIYANASGYTPASRFGLQASTPGSTNTYALTLYPSSYVAPPSGNTILYATVTSVCQQQYQSACSDLPLGGVTITVRSVDGTTFSQSGVTGTGSSGTITMYIPNYTAYFWSATGKPGYQDVSGNFTITNQPVYTLGIQMTQIFITPTPSGITPLPTGVTPTPTKGATQSEGEYQAELGLDVIASAIVGWAKVGVGIVSIWLLWVLVYEMTGGKVIEKIMRRGRGGRK